jgi:hypothetical protein
MMNDLEKQIHTEILRAMTLLAIPEEQRAKVQVLQDFDHESWDELSRQVYWAVDNTGAPQDLLAAFKKCRDRDLSQTTLNDLKTAVRNYEKSKPEVAAARTGE